MGVHHFHVPAEAARREYAVYIIVAAHRISKKIRLYVGKTGDNREGCNPIISRAGNHLSFNPIHSQSRNRLGDPENYDFDFFFTCFGGYVEPSKSRAGIDLVNEMERQLNVLAQETLGEIENPYKGTAHVSVKQREYRRKLALPQRIKQLQDLVDTVKRHLRNIDGAGK